MAPDANTSAEVLVEVLGQAEQVSIQQAIREMRAGGLRSIGKDWDLGRTEVGEVSQLQRTVTSQDKAIVVTLPSKLLESVGSTGYLAITQLDGTGILNALENRSEGSDKFISSPIAVTLFDSLGERVKVKDLTERIEITLGSGPAPEGTIACGYFDEEALRWRFNNIQELGKSGELPRCAVDHLSIFSLFSIKCSNIAVLSEDSLKEMTKGSWYRDLASILLWSMIFLEVICFAIAVHRDRLTRREDAWIDDYFLTENPDAMEKSFMERLLDLASEFRFDSGAVDRLRKKSLCEEVGSRIVKMCITAASSVDLGMAMSDLKRHTLEEIDVRAAALNVSEVMCAKESGIKKKRKSVSFADLEHVPKRLAKAVEDGYMYEDAKRFIYEMGFLRRAWVLFLAQHKVLLAYRYSIYSSSTFLVVTLAAKMQTSLMVSALFFQTVEQAVSSKARDACQPDGLAETIARDVFVGIISSIIALLPHVILPLLNGRSFVVMRGDSKSKEKQKRQMLIYWKVSDFIFYLLELALYIFSGLFVASFLANVGPVDRIRWLRAASTELILGMIVTPAALSLLLAMLFSLVFFLSPKLVKAGLHHIPRVEEGRRNFRTRTLTMTMTSTMTTTTNRTESVCSNTPRMERPREW
eukprot:CAMPEP_0170570136 /NCGR_PEP_ID=MMETSP0224-20130122/942_1 /TAXON_ID=285029 /ORGANISM="Togula jolla, Strain CCCM 725" /LENGTH=638 /DNA_ID=CAMNT_0010892379 /DNA_START=137 /DNA_END=2050 /DNA_ORIENTATION=+